MVSEDDRKRKNLRLKLAVFRYYKLITVFLVILIVFLSYYFILEPKYQQVGVGGRYNLDTLKDKLSERERYLENLKKLTANYQKISQADINNLKNILPNQKDIPGIFVQLQALAEEYNFLLSGVSINEVPKEVKKGKESPEKISKLNISLNLIGSGESGNYAELKDFLSALEDNLRLFDVNAVYFTPDSPNYSINIFSYYYKGD